MGSRDSLLICMREILIVVGLMSLAMAMRSTRTRLVRKLGAGVLLAASFFLFYYLSGSVGWGIFGVILWFFLPWIELLTRIRRLRLPVNNRLSFCSMPDCHCFPNAPEAAAAMEEAGFDHVSDCGWEWNGMRQFFRIFWHPEERAVAAVCLCEQCDVAFAFITVTSRDSSGQLWRTTNFPFAPTLRCLPEIHWNHIPCRYNCFHKILEEHHRFLKNSGVPVDSLRIPDPDQLEQEIEEEMRRQLEHNKCAGIIRFTPDGRFEYSTRGLFFLWGQFIKDMIRFC